MISYISMSQSASNTIQLPQDVWSKISFYNSHPCADLMKPLIKQWEWLVRDGDQFTSTIKFKRQMFHLRSHHNHHMYLRSLHLKKHSCEADDVEDYYDDTEG